MFRAKMKKVREFRGLFFQAISAGTKLHHDGADHA